eukprot:6206506-Prymnesium_polylepis.1
MQPVTFDWAGHATQAAAQAACSLHMSRACCSDSSVGYLQAGGHALKINKRPEIGPDAWSCPILPDTCPILPDT